jgi:hypothetical protein
MVWQKEHIIKRRKNHERKKNRLKKKFTLILSEWLTPSTMTLTTALCCTLGDATVLMTFFDTSSPSWWPVMLLEAVWSGFRLINNNNKRLPFRLADRTSLATTTRRLIGRMGVGHPKGVSLWPLNCPLITIHLDSPWSWNLPPVNQFLKN